MKRLQPVIWAKGTFLSPQHLQVQDQYIESLLRFRMQSLSFRPWGFSSLAIDQEALAGGRVVIDEAAGLFPDGLAFSIPDSDHAPPPRELKDQFGKDDKQMDIYLYIPPLRDQGYNVAMADTSANTRFRAELAPFRDENTGESEKSILVSRKNFRILTQNEAKEGASIMRVARVLKQADDSYVLDNRFVPPLLSVRSSDFLLGIARRMVEVLSARSSELSSTRRHKNQVLADFTTSDLANFWLLYNVNHYLPRFRHIYQSNPGHPEELFSQMLEMAGALTTFSNEIKAADLPGYDHTELGECFADLEDKLHKLLQTVIPRNFVALNLKYVKDSIYAAAIEKDSYIRNTRIFLAINAGTDEASLIKKPPRLLKVSSADRVEHLVNQALPGVKLEHVPIPPGEVPVKLNYQYFRVSQSGDDWAAIARSRNLAAYVPSDFPDPRLELIILLPQAR